MGNRAGTAALCCLCAIVICGCAIESAGERIDPVLRVDNLGDCGSYAWFQEIACWGDSMTEGVGASANAIVVTHDLYYDASYKSYPAILQDLTHMKTFNYGVAGATSMDIATMQGAYPREEADGDSRWRGIASLFHTDDGPLYDERIAELGDEHHGDILVLELGSNGGWDDDYDELIAQYEAMIAHVNCKGYIILGDTDDPGTSYGDPGQEPFEPGEGPGVTDWEKALSEHFGEHFVNVRLFLIDHGLEVTGLREEPDDRDRASTGCISEQLKADWTHLNSYGYYAKAVAVYERGIELGYWV